MVIFKAPTAWRSLTEGSIAEFELHQGRFVLIDIVAMGEVHRVDLTTVFEAVFRLAKALETLRSI